ncbi:MAG: trypsin-like peptidase domain-containing protein [Deltaproteobacteria bacterium]|nr:trypsin-like peptidase domain-containing protein [Deltaproteobacteria bacterium]
MKHISILVVNLFIVLFTSFSFTVAASYNSEIDQAQKMLWDGTELGYGIPEPYNQIAKEAKSGQVDLAIAKLNILIKKNPQDFFAYYLRGLAYSFHKGLYDKAIEDFNTVFKLTVVLKTKNPVAIVIYFYRSDAYYLKGDYDTAIDDINEAIKIAELIEGGHKFLPISYSLRGKYFSAKGEYARAIVNFKRAIELGSNDGFTFWGLAYSLHQTGQKDRARFFFNKTPLTPSANDSSYLDKPISLKTKCFISRRIEVAAEYIPMPEDMLSKASVYINTYFAGSGRQELAKNAQKILIELGYNPGPIDGIVGPQTRTAIRKFQSDYRIPIDGKVSEKLRRKLTIALKESPKPPFTKKKEIPSAKYYKDIPTLVKRIGPAIVTIIGYNNKRVPIRGSGFFISNNLVITNHHVIENVNSLRVKTYEGNKHGVEKIQAVDRSHDLAIIKLKAPYHAQRRLSLNKEQPRIGERILVIGNPRGLEQTVSDGIISAIRETEKVTYIQITAPISPGSSGSPVVNLKGEVIGVVTLFLKKGQNLNFAVSSKHIARMIDRFK